MVSINRTNITVVLNTERLLEFTETGEDPYEAIPHLSNLMIDNFVGEYKVNGKLENLSYLFIQAIPRTEIEWYAFCLVEAVGISEEECQEVMEL